MVNGRGYLTESELIELHALCQILPGPTSTQTITAIGFRIGGPGLAYLTLLVWITPAVTIMTVTGIIFSSLHENQISLEFTKFIQPMAIGFVGYAAYLITTKVVKTRLAYVILAISAVLSYTLGSPFIFPVIILAGGAATAIQYRKQPKSERRGRPKIIWTNLILWAGVLAFAAFLGKITQERPIQLFENFYRNGSLIFGGGQVLVPLLLSEFVNFKHYLSPEEFLSGFAVVQAIPGPVFSFSSYIGALSMREYGTIGEVLGGIFAAIGIFLPGTFLIFFVIRFWDDLKKYRIVRASLEGINAASSGMVIAATLLLFDPMDVNVINVSIIAGTFAILAYTKVPAPLIILCGLGLGFII